MHGDQDVMSMGHGENCPSRTFLLFFSYPSQRLRNFQIFDGIQHLRCLLLQCQHHVFHSLVKFYSDQRQNLYNGYLMVAHLKEPFSLG